MAPTSCRLPLAPRLPYLASFYGHPFSLLLYLSTFHHTIAYALGTPCSPRIFVRYDTTPLFYSTVLLVISQFSLFFSGCLRICFNAPSRFSTIRSGSWLSKFWLDFYSLLYLRTGLYCSLCFQRISFTLRHLRSVSNVRCEKSKTWHERGKDSKNERVNIHSYK